MIFEEQISRKPDHYKWTEQYMRSMWEGHWTDKEFSFAPDIQDFKVKLTEQEREIIIRTLSAIAQIEVAVKTFWAKLGDNLPHPSIRDLGYVMANVEVIHNNAYERLLEVLGIEEEIEKNLKLEWIENRVNYLRKYTHRYYKDSKKQFVYALILFTLFVENVSLFSQFYIINWFGKRNLLKHTNQQTKYTAREESHIEGTEILTPSGWVDLSNIKEGDSVYQYNQNQTISPTKVLKYHSYNYKGGVYRFSKQGMECCVTPNHDIIYFNPKGEFIKKKAKDVKIHKNFLLPHGGFLENNPEGPKDITTEEALRISIQADGTTLYWVNTNGERKNRGDKNGYTHSFGFTKDRKKEKLIKILKKLGVEYKESACKRNPGHTLFKIKYNHDFDYKKFDWVDLSSKNHFWCRSFIAEVVQWDGHTRDSGSSLYSSSNKKCIDIVQTIAILAGFKTHINSQIYEEKNHKTNYRLSFVFGNFRPRSHATKKTIEDYSGMCYCVTVPSGNIITRLNDKTFIAGNCIHALAGTKLIQTIREEHPELFDAELEERVLSEAKEACKAEEEIVDWLVNGLDEELLSASILKEFVRNRLNESLQMIGYKKVFEVDEDVLSNTEWFEEETVGNIATDFFDSRPIDYAKDNQSFSAEDLF